jgi:hypothetical protein
MTIVDGRITGSIPGKEYPSQKLEA